MTQDELKEILDYQPDTGFFVWRVRRNGRAGGVWPGDVAGKTMKVGYINIGALGKEWLAHRLAFLFMNGSFPNGVVDHIDHNRTNNKWDNLRDVSHRENIQHRSGAQRNSRSGILGVHQRKDQRWVASICAGGRLRFLGSYSTPEDARTAYLAAKRVLHLSTN